MHEVLSSLKVDDIGLDELDRKYLRAIIEKYRGGPVGVETFAASISEDSTSLEDVVEPFLLQLGLSIEHLVVGVDAIGLFPSKPSMSKANLAR